MEFPLIYKGYVIDQYDEQELVGGSYENNEKREYRKTGKDLYSVKGGSKGKKSLSKII